MKYFPTLFSSLFFIFIANVSVAAPAVLNVQHLIQNGPYLKKVLDQAGSAKVLKYYVFDQPDSSFEKAFMPYACYFESEIGKKPCTNRAAEDWQNKIIKDVNNQISGILGINLVEVETESESDFLIIIHNNRDQDYNGGLFNSQDDKKSLNMSWGTGLPKPTPLGLKHSVAQQKGWQKIYIHELGHMLGLEHPFDKDDGDWAVDSSNEPTEDTVMGWNDENSKGEVYTWFTAIDINALTEIWGKGEWLGLYSGVAPPAGSDISFNNIGTFNSSDQTIYTCLRVFTGGLPGSVGGIGQYDIGLKIYSLQDLTFQASKSREFNSTRALNENGEAPDCSGKFETTTGVFTDIIQAGDSAYEIIFSLTDTTNLLLTIQSYKVLPKLSSVSALTFNPAKNSKTMPIEKNIDITFSSTIKKGEGVITLKDSAGNTVESYQAGVSSNITISGSVLSINPTAILASDKSYFINIPVGAVRDSAGDNFKGVVDHEFKTQIDVAFMLMGYNGTTRYETTDSFKAEAELATTQMRLLSFNRLNSYRTHMLPISNRNGESIQAKVEIDIIDSALNDWGPDDVFTNKYYEMKTRPGALRNPTAEEISVLKSLRQWLVENEKGALNWKDTDLGKEHYQWIFEKVIAFCSPASRGMLDGTRMPAGFDVKEYRVISIILSSDDTYNVGAVASSFNSWGGNDWNILDSEGVQYTDHQPFFFDDHSDLLSGAGSAGKLKNVNAKVDVHEYIHTQGGEHDNEKWDDTCVSPYSIMSACDSGDFFTYPIYNRIYIMGWLPETAVTTDPSQIQDSYNATDPSKKYLLKLGNFRYQELFNGRWYQYSVRSFERQMGICNNQVKKPDGTVIGGGWRNINPNEVDPLYICGQLVVDPACIVTGPSPLPGFNGEAMTGRDFSNCEFIDIETEFSRGLFAKFLGRLDGSMHDYSGALDRNALRMEVTDDAARQALSN